MSLVPPKVVTAHPDIDVVHSMVAAAIARAEGEKPPPVTSQPSPATTEGSEATSETDPETDPAPADEGAQEAPVTPAQPPSMTGGSFGSLKDGYAANQADDLGSAC